jgi:L-lactate dehydrogenase complex protein LldF
MDDIATKFKNDAEQKSFDLKHRATIDFNILRYDEAVNEGLKQYKDFELAKNRAAFIKNKAIDDLENQLLKFESNFSRNGGKIIWAKDGKEALKSIVNVLNKAKAKRVVKSKSMTTEEIDLNKALENNKIECVETDLGEYIVQIANEKPYHIVTPAMHKSKEDIAKLFHEKLIRIKI